MPRFQFFVIKFEFLVLAKHFQINHIIGLTSAYLLCAFLMLYRRRRFVPIKQGWWPKKGVVGEDQEGDYLINEIVWD